MAKKVQPVEIKITGVKVQGGQEQPVSISFEGSQKVFRPCKSMSRVLVAAWGADSSSYVGRELTLYRDPKVKWGGMEVGGIRISHMTGIDKPIDLMLTTTRSKRAVYTVKPLTTTPMDYPAADFAANLDKWVAAIKAGKLTIPTLMQKVASKGVLSTEQREIIERQVAAGESK
jgi:hypothetical protein